MILISAILATCRLEATFCTFMQNIPQSQPHIILEELCDYLQRALGNASAESYCQCR